MPRLNDSDGDPIESEFSSSDEDWIPVYRGEALRFDELHEIGYAHPFRLVTLIGEPDCGKTTFLTRLYGAFLKEPFANHLFAGSRTLPAFEKSCFKERTCSKKSESKVDRTLLASGPNFYHLAVRETSLSQGIEHLVLGDIPGELLSLARKNRQDAESIAPILQKSDRVVCLVDGEKMEGMTRLMTKSNIRTLMRALTESSALDNRSAVDLVISKWDLLTDPSAATASQAFLNEERDYWKSKVGKIETYAIAARSKNPGVVGMYGIEALFGSWIKPQNQVKPAESRHRQLFSRSFLNYRSE